MSELQSAALLGAAAIVVVLAVGTLYRVVVGPTLQDRLVAVNVLGTSAVIVIALVSGGLGRPEYLNVAVVYALLNFTVSLAAARFSYYSEEVQ